MNILFVCTANVSRSFLAEHLFRHELLHLGLSGVAVSSAGVADFAGSPPDSKMVEFLSKQKIPFEKTGARVIEPEQMVWADRVLVMEEEHAEFLREIFPESAEKVGLLGAYVPPGDPTAEIADPYGLSAYHYRTTISQITLAVKNLVQELAAEP
jgi:protein-tyrosine phosphatase